MIKSYLFLHFVVSASLQLVHLSSQDSRWIITSVFWSEWLISFSMSSHNLCATFICISSGNTKCTSTYLLFPDFLVLNLWKLQYSELYLDIQSFTMLISLSDNFTSTNGLKAFFNRHKASFKINKATIRAIIGSRKCSFVIHIRKSPTPTPREVYTSVLRWRASASKAIESVFLATLYNLLDTKNYIK